MSSWSFGWFGCVLWQSGEPSITGFKRVQKYSFHLLRIWPICVITVFWSSLHIYGSLVFCHVSCLISLKNFLDSFFLLLSSICLITLLSHSFFFLVQILLASFLFLWYPTLLALVLSCNQIFLASFFPWLPIGNLYPTTRFPVSCFVFGLFHSQLLLLPIWTGTITLIYSQKLALIK